MPGRLLPLALCAILLVRPSSVPVAAAPPSPVRLGPDARVRFVTAYPACGLERSGEGPLPPALAGLDAQQAARALAPDVVTGLSPGLLTVRRQWPGCPADSLTLAIRGGEVVVLAGRPGDSGPITGRSGIPARALTPASSRALENGLRVPAAEAPAALRGLAGS